MKKGKDYGLLIASMVAIVAIVGLVIMFSGGTTGAAAGKSFAVSDAMRCYNDGGQMVCPGVSDTGGVFAPKDIKNPADTYNPSTVQTNKPFPEDAVEHSIYDEEWQ